MKYIWEEGDIEAGLMFYYGDNINYIFELKNTGYIIAYIDSGFAASKSIGVYSNENYVFSINEVVEYLNNNRCVPV